MSVQEYNTVLVALDVYGETSSVLERALRVVGEPNKIHLVYVAYPQTTFEPYGIFLEQDYTEQISRRAREKMDIIALRHTIPGDNVHVLIGSPADEISHAAEKLQADLIVIGTHGQKGVKLLMGSTANAVLHGFKADVLAVRLI